MPYSFEGRTAYEIVIAITHASDVEETKALFKALESVDAHTRDIVVSKLEKETLLVVNDIQQTIEDLGVARARKKLMGEHSKDPAAESAQDLAFVEMVRQIVALRGEAAADPALKGIVAEMSKLSPQDAAKENAVMGAVLDALVGAMQADGTLAAIEEGMRLEKIQDAFSWRMTIGVKEHFNKIGKLEEFAAAPTEAEKAEQKAAMKGLLWKSGAEEALSSLTATDVFMRVARRVGTDADLAALLPADKFEASDVALLEKNKLTSLAALVKTAIANKPAQG